MKLFKKTLLVCLSIVMILSLIPVSAANAIEQDMKITELEPMSLEHCAGGATYDIEELLAHKLSDNEMAELMATASTLPSSHDNSTSIYFPPIGNQGSVGSCGAFSTTYYQFTYEANKLNNIASNSNDTIYSPAWPYYSIASGNTGVSVSDVFDFLRDHGALSLTNFPYETTFQSSMPYPTSVELMREALKTRVSDWTPVPLDGTGTPITGPTSSQLAPIKQHLYQGKVLNIVTSFSFNYGLTSAGEEIAYRCTRGDSGHAMTVVGYDDTIMCDVNGNGTIESAERGAFKIANSHGTENHNDGYMWVLYDALNQISAISGSWESKLDGTRTEAFNYINSSDHINWFMFIEVVNKELLFLAEANFVSAKRSEMEIWLEKRQVGYPLAAEVFETSHKHIGPSTSNSFTLLFSYDSVETGFDYDYTGHHWNVTLPMATSADIGSASGRVCDDRGQEVATYQWISYSCKDRPPVVGEACSSSTCTVADHQGKKLNAAINLQFGDLNYDGTISNRDATALLRYLSSWDNLSNVQEKLADFNRDGTVDNRDSTALLQHIANG